MDMFSKKKRSEIMGSIRSKDTKMEVSFRHALWAKGFHYRKNPKKYFGKPDLVLKKFKTVIFLDSCFWHACPDHFHFPKTKKKYWKNKLERNKIRDVEVSEYYFGKDWNVIRVWEHDIVKSRDKVISDTLKLLANSRKG